jgi:hypothetical protein
MKKTWQGVITNARFVKLNELRCIRGRFLEPVRCCDTVLNLKGQTFNIGPVKRVNRTPNGAVVYTALGRYTVVGAIA